MQVNRAELVEKLEFVLPAIGSNSLVLDHQKLHFSGETLFASDGTISIYTSSPIPEEFFSVKAESFCNLLRNISTQEVKLAIKDSSLSVRTKRLEGKFAIDKPIEIPPRPEGDKNAPSEEFFEALSLCKLGVCKEKTSGAIGGVHIEGGRIFSTDRLRIHKYSLSIPTNISSCTLPVKFIDIIQRRKDDIRFYGLMENQFYMVLEDGSLVCTNVFPDKFPELNQYFSDLGQEYFVELSFKSDLASVVERHLRSFLGGEEFFEREIRFKVKNQTCFLYSEKQGGGDLLEEIELESDAGELEFILNPSLLEALQYPKGSEGRFLFDRVGKVVLLDAGKFQALIQTKV